ncbi:hypothetical protein HZ326_16811 [Fusarium oxysporum f. sp. albedinis]|nr:hypothetical protein HZ326_16811 [Fusarium oxysporum f. sp. albedinis]
MCTIIYHLTPLQSRANVAHDRPACTASMAPWLLAREPHGTSVPSRRQPKSTGGPSLAAYRYRTVLHITWRVVSCKPARTEDAARRTVFTPTHLLTPTTPVVLCFCRYHSLSCCAMCNNHMRQ